MKAARLGLRSLAVAAILSLGLVPSVAIAADGGDSASGHVTDVANYQYDFTARSTAVGTGASGNAKLTIVATDPNRVYSGDVTCLRVVGATLTAPAATVIGVRITNEPVGDPYQTLFIYATDTGKFSSVPDTITWALSASPPPLDGACPAPIPGTGFPVVKGDITISNTLP